MARPPEHVFVLMLENRSFDHMLGFSGLTGVDAETGGAAAIDGLTGGESNAFGGVTYPVVLGADYVMPADPGHDFSFVLDQLCGPAARYAPPYPPVDGSGFVDSYSRVSGPATAGVVMRCFDTPRQLPVLHALAREYAVCDRWFSSMPGPTAPNRMFVHAGSSGGLDHSPTTEDVVEWETIDGFAFPRGTVFDALKKRSVPYGLYSGDEFPMVGTLKGITVFDVRRIDALAEELARDSFGPRYVFIEPSYNVLQEFRGSSSQHPFADVRDGEALIKTVYEAIRSSPVWERSLLLLLWDEHGGFYDHVAPPPAVAPDDGAQRSKYNGSGFTFAQYGVRTPAIVVSPYVARGTIDHRVYDHTSVLATVREAFGGDPLTARDAQARSVVPLLSLVEARPDAPRTLPTPAEGAASSLVGGVARPGDAVNDGMLPSVLHAALRHDLLDAGASKAEILDRVRSLASRDDALRYLTDVRARLRTP